MTAKITCCDPIVFPHETYCSSELMRDESAGNTATLRIQMAVTDQGAFIRARNGKCVILFDASCWHGLVFEAMINRTRKLIRQCVTDFQRDAGDTIVNVQILTPRVLKRRDWCGAEGFADCQLDDIDIGDHRFWVWYLESQNYRPYSAAARAHLLMQSLKHALSR